MFDKKTRLRRTCWVVLVVTMIWGITFIVIAAVPCVPVSAFWNRGSGTCYGYGSINTPSLQGIYTTHNATNVLLDLIILAIPVPLYFDKSTPWKMRMGIGCLLMLGVAYVAFLYIYLLRFAYVAHDTYFHTHVYTFSPPSPPLSLFPPKFPS